ncbi:MAG: potassium-transporting ATPase subunit B, partial [Methyloglobulus sp.]|nr:potassium-transporting ATPase subunit B [Methyloglobulus sp.]
MSKQSKTTAMFTVESVKDAAIGAIGKLTPRQQWKNPVMFVVYLGSLLTTLLWLNSLNNVSDEPSNFILAISLWLWFTVLFANFAEAMAEGRSKAQAAFLRSAKRDIIAKKLDEPRFGSNYSKVTGSSLRKEDVVLIEAGDFIPGDGDVIEGVATVDESAITGESAPVIRESGGDFSSVTGGTRVLSDWLVVRISANPGESFLDKMISMVESASRQKTPNEIALTILLVALTLVFLMATVTLLPFSLYSVQSAGAGHPISIT